MFSTRNPKRVLVFRNGTSTGGKVFVVYPDTILGSGFQGFTWEIKRRFDIPISKWISVFQACLDVYTREGFQIGNCDAIRDGDTVYFAEKGQAFVPPKAVPILDDVGLGGPPPSAQPVGIIRLNIGGTYFETTPATFARICNPNHRGGTVMTRDITGAYFFDRDPKYFGVVLNSVRYGKLIVEKGLDPEAVRMELKHWGVHPGPNLPITTQAAGIAETGTPEISGEDGQSAIQQPATSAETIDPDQDENDGHVNISSSIPIEISG